MPEQQNRIDIYVGQKIKRRRAEIGMSIEDLSVALDYPAEEVAAYEAGNLRIGPSALLEISRVLGSPLNYFFDDVTSYRTRKASDNPLGIGKLTKTEVEDSTAEIVELLLAINRIQTSPHKNKLMHLLSSLENILGNIAKEKN